MKCISTRGFKFVLIAAVSGFALSGCQTTNTGFDTTREVDVSETRIELPAELLALKGFRIKKAEIEETGSYRRETVYFTGGYFSFDRYMRGGFLQEDRHRFNKRVAKFFTAPTSVAPARIEHMAIGDVYYTSLKDKGDTCVVMSGNYGASMQLRGGRGYEGWTFGYYCEPGDLPKLEETALKWMKRIRLR